jgi:hypothetical protein
VSTGLVDVSNRVWLGWGRVAFGVGIGTQSARLDQPIDSLQPPPPQAVRPSMSLGWRYNLTDSSSFYAGASAARAWGEPDALPQYGARAGVEWKTARSRLGFDGGRLGLQLDSGYRMSIRTRSGGLQVALRRNF